VSTASTKSRSKKQKRKSAVWGARSSRSVEPAAAESAHSGDLSERAWQITAIAIMLVGAFLRLYNLSLVPLHHDEGVNGNFLVSLVRNGVYHYDPENYHGPSLYYISAIIPWTIKLLFGPAAQDKYGLTTFNIRLVPALFGLATIWLVLLLRRRLGTIATLSAAALLAISPGAVYLSRYFIHESLFVFFTLGIVVASLRYYEDRHPVYLILAAASTALLFTTKETFIINAPVLVIALVSTRVYQWLGKRQSVRRSEKPTDRWRKTVERLGGPGNLAAWSLVAVVVFVAISVLFYSSFFRNWPKGVYDSLGTFQVWTKTGQTQHVHPLSKYLEWLGTQEGALLVLGAIGALFAVLRPRNTFAIFSGLWAFGILAAYSLVKYKTPWLALNFIVPLALIGGYGIEVLYRHAGDVRLPLLAVMLAILIAAGYQSGSAGTSIRQIRRVVAASVPGYQTIDLNFFNYDNDDAYYVYVYAHTRRGTQKLVDEIQRVAEHNGTRGETGITIVSPDYWPLPWYLRDYTRVGYYGHMSATDEPLIIASETQATEVEATFGSRYHQISSGVNSAGSFALRPGVDLLLYVRRDLPRR
jgi:uncharacterized protein (TIGR03663 family)